MTVSLIALSSQHDHVEEVQTWLKNTGLEVEAKFSDVNEDAQAILTKFNLTIQPVLVDISSVNGEDVATKFAEGAEIMLMPADKITAVRTAITGIPA